MKIAISHRQSPFRLRQAKIRALLRHLARQLEAATPGTVWREIALVLTDDATMCALNRTWFAHDSVTDAISLSYDALPGEPEGRIAEIFVNVADAWREGTRRAGSSPERELALYMAHGLHHLAGADDNTPARRRAMLRTEWQWVRAAEREGWLAGLEERAEGK